MKETPKAGSPQVAGAALAAVMALSLLAGGAAGLQTPVRTANKELPTARVERGDLDLTMYARGETRSFRTALLTAPPVRGTLKMTHLLYTGSQVKEGESIIEFDPSEQEFNIDQARNELLQAEQEITKARADGAVQTAQDEVTLMKARFDVRRAELEVGRNELASAIDAKKNSLNLEEARRRLAQLEQDIESRKVTNQAGIAVLEQKRNKERLDLERAEQDMKNMKITAPFAGLVAVKENRDASGGMWFPGIVLPEYRAGDMVSPGRPIAEVLDTTQMEIQAKINENDRARLKPGQAVEIRLDTRPLQPLTGKVKSVGGTASRGWGPSASTRSFDVAFTLDNSDIPLRPGATAEVKVTGEQVKNALLLPRQAIFEKEGKPIVHVKTGPRFEPKEIKVLHRTESKVAIEGLAEGTEVALADPEKGSGGPSKSGGPFVAPGRP